MQLSFATNSLSHSCLLIKRTFYLQTGPSLNVCSAIQCYVNRKFIAFEKKLGFNLMKVQPEAYENISTCLCISYENKILCSQFEFGDYILELL